METIGLRGSMLGVTKGKKEKQGNSLIASGEWAVEGLSSPPRSEVVCGESDSSWPEGPPSSNETYQTVRPSLPSSTEFVNRNPGGAAGNQLKEASRGKKLRRSRNKGRSGCSRNGVESFGFIATNQVAPESLKLGQSSSPFLEGGRSCIVSKGVQAAVPGSAAEGDRDKTKSENREFMENGSAVGSSTDLRLRQGEEDKLGDVRSGLNQVRKIPLAVEEPQPSQAQIELHDQVQKASSNMDLKLCHGEQDKPTGIESVLNQLKNFSLAVEESQLLKTQIELNDQEQEDEVLALKAIYGDDVWIFEREDGGPRAFKISIHVDLHESIAIVVRLPSSSDKCESSGNSSSIVSKNGTSVLNTYTLEVQYLPPIGLVCVLPKSYPCDSPPQFAIWANWLDSVQISKLCNSLDNIWIEESGAVVIYKWAEWLRSSTLSHLGFHNEVDLGPYNIPSNVDWRAISGCISPDVDIPRLMHYNDQRKNEEFRRTLHVCPICFTEYPGTEFVKLLCQHIFCWKCMETYSRVHVKDGTVNKLNCPDTKCRASISPDLLKQLLGDEAFERWESLLLQKTLDSMVDVVYCPRCESICLEDEDHHAQCGKCFFSFCSLCRERRHVGQTCMTPEFRLRILQERQNSCQVGAEQRKREQELINELLSMKQILRHAKQCPSCKMAISKTEGCNKMTCANCGQYFCYRCNKEIDGYDHFSGGSCILFEQQEIQNWERMMNDRQLQAQAQVELWPHLGRPCPNCGQRNVKQGNNNHIFCWSCQIHYCALCHKVVRRSSEHYGPKGCKQHTAD